MANILPPEAIKRLSRVYLARFFIAFALALGALALVMQLTLVPSYLALNFSVPSAPASSAPAADSTDAQTIARAQTLLSKITPVLSAPQPSAIVGAILADKPADVTIEHVTFSLAGTSTGMALVIGTAPREEIDAFRTSLSKDSLFTSVAVPASALVGSDAGHFSMTIGIAPKK